MIFNPVENYVQAFGIETSGFQIGDKNEMLLFRLIGKIDLSVKIPQNFLRLPGVLLNVRTIVHLPPVIKIFIPTVNNLFHKILLFITITKTTPFSSCKSNL